MKKSSIIDSKQKGQDLVEFALVLPVLLLVIVGMLDLGRAFFSAIAVANVAREGARFGVNLDWDLLCETDCSVGEGQAQAAAFNEAANTGLDLTNLTVVADCGVCSSDDHDPLELTVTYNFDMIFNSILPDLSIQRTARMRIP